MPNFRKLKQDYSPSLLKEGKGLYERDMVLAAKIVQLTGHNARISCQVRGSYENTYECEFEIDLDNSTVTDSNCDCPHNFDCVHLAAVLFYLEEHYNQIIVTYSKETDLEEVKNIDDDEKKTLLETFKEAETREVVRQGKKYQKELLQDYIGASQVLGQSPFFLPQEEFQKDRAEVAVIVTFPQSIAGETSYLELQLSLRLPTRSKPLNIPNIKLLLDAIRYREPIYIGSKRYFFDLSSFDNDSALILNFLMDAVQFPEVKGEKNLRVGQISSEVFGTILAEIYEITIKRQQPTINSLERLESKNYLPCLYLGSQEEPLLFSNTKAMLHFEMEYLTTPAPALLLNPTIVLKESTALSLENVTMFECAQPGLIHNNIYYSFHSNIKRKHLRNLQLLREMAIPEPLFGTFVENSLPELMRFGQVTNRDIIEKFVTLPFVGNVNAECDINYLNGELEAFLYFVYDEIKIPAATSQLHVDQICSFVTPQGILARNLTEEQKIIEDLFQDFIYDSSQGAFIAKTEKKIVEFMTDVIPSNLHRVDFHCPENLLDQFLYDDTQFKLSLKETSRIDVYQVDLVVDGHLNGTKLDLLWDCLASKRSYIELMKKKGGRKKKGEGSSNANQHKILVLDLEKLAPVVQIFDEIGITDLTDHTEERPLWSLASIDESQFKGLPIKFSMSKKLKEIQEQMLGTKPYNSKDIPKEIQAKLREYQSEGVSWLERLRSMHLNGVLADDMGLGKTLQAIIAVSQYKIEHPKSLALVVCPTSLIYNWKEEFTKFNPNLSILPVDGTPAQRKKLLTGVKKYDVVITSYSLLQKDIEIYQSIPFGYAILDEAQHIKNRSTRNAKSVKMVQAAHRLILTGTPIENSLDELWSLFDFLMPGLLSSYDRFVEKYIRNAGQNQQQALEGLRRKVSPFILRRMKQDVLSELPPVSEIIYHCHLTETQRDLYRSYAASARQELAQLVEKEGFDRVQIHVLATLTRLKQICCHPAIFAKDRAEMGDSAKYDMLMELLHTLIEGRHKTVIFSQYTRMLNIMREDMQRQGIKFEYLDGSSKNRLDIVKRFNEEENIPVFLVSLKAGGVGLNLTSADTVIHYDMWWNPAVENQATDRVHRIGQKSNVSSYKLITLGTIEEKILELQNRKRGLVTKVVSCDDEAMSKLTWEEVLELLQA